MKKSKLEQKVTYKSLGVVLNADKDFLLEAALEDETVQKKHKMKNVCAMLSGDLTERLENVLNKIGITKREFLELAIIDALDKTEVIMEDAGIDEYYSVLADELKASRVELKAVTK